MITKEYVSSFKEGHTFCLLKQGIAEGKMESVLLGYRPYDIAYKTEPIPTVPSQVVIVLHILVGENGVTNDDVNKAFVNLPISEETVCIILQYIHVYLIYREEHSSLCLDIDALINRVNASKQDYSFMICYQNLSKLVNEKKKEGILVCKNYL